MAETTVQAQNPRPSEWLFKNVVNPTMKLILRSPMHRLMSNILSLLTFTGRTSGKQFTTPVAYHRESDKRVYIFTRSPWWKNLRDGKPVSIRIKGQQLQGVATVIEDKGEVWQLISRYIKEYGGHRRVGVMLAEDASDADVRAAASDLVAIKIELKS